MPEDEENKQVHIPSLENLIAVMISCDLTAVTCEGQAGASSFIAHSAYERLIEISNFYTNKNNCPAAIIKDDLQEGILSWVEMHDQEFISMYLDGCDAARYDAALETLRESWEKDIRAVFSDTYK